MTKYEVIKTTIIIRNKKIEIEATYNTEEEARGHIDTAIQREVNIRKPESRRHICKVVK